MTRDECDIICAELGLTVLAYAMPAKEVNKHTQIEWALIEWTKDSNIKYKPEELLKMHKELYE